MRTLAVTMVGIVALIADLAIRFLWWGGGRAFGDDDNNGGGPQAILALVGFVLLLFAPIIAQLMQFAVSRNREGLADISGVEMTRYPPGLISALEKLRDDQTVVHSASRATAHLWIESPIAREKEEGKLSRLNRLFDTHPPLERAHRPPPRALTPDRHHRSACEKRRWATFSARRTSRDRVGRGESASGTGASRP